MKEIHFYSYEKMHLTLSLPKCEKMFLCKVLFRAFVIISTLIFFLLLVGELIYFSRLYSIWREVCFTHIGFSSLVIFLNMKHRMVM